VQRTVHNARAADHTQPRSLAPIAGGPIKGHHFVAGLAAKLTSLSIGHLNSLQRPRLAVPPGELDIRGGEPAAVGEKIRQPFAEVIEVIEVIAAESLGQARELAGGDVVLVEPEVVAEESAEDFRAPAAERDGVERW